MSHLHLLLLLRWSSYYPPPLPNTNNQSWCTVSSIITRNCLSSALLKTESLIRSKCSLTNYKVLDLQVCLDPARIQNQRRPRTVSDDGWGPSLSASGLNLIEFSFIWKLLKYEKKSQKITESKTSLHSCSKANLIFPFDWVKISSVASLNSSQLTTDAPLRAPPGGRRPHVFFFYLSVREELSRWVCVDLSGWIPRGQSEEKKTAGRKTSDRENSHDRSV